MLLQSISHMNPALYHRALRKQAELWEHILEALGGEWERSWSRRWDLEPDLSLHEVLEDLEYGRD